MTRSRRLISSFSRLQACVRNTIEFTPTGVDITLSISRSW